MRPSRLSHRIAPPLLAATALLLLASGAHAQGGTAPVKYVRYAAGALPPGVSNPDFTFKSIRGNAVLRWEFKPGSAAYFVWTQSRDDAEANGEFRFGNSFRSLLDAKADNIFLVKFAFGWTS